MMATLCYSSFSLLTLDLFNCCKDAEHSTVAVSVASQFMSTTVPDRTTMRLQLMITLTAAVAAHSRFSAERLRNMRDSWASAELFSTPPAEGATLYPPFTPSPPLVVVDINGSTMTLPQAGSPLVVYAYDKTDATAEAMWSSTTNIEKFLSESVFSVDTPNSETRYAFLSFNTAPGGAAADANAMRGNLTARMAALSWPASNITAWLSRATFGAEPVVAGGQRLGWVADLLSNWTNVGTSLELRLATGASATLSVPRIDAVRGWLPPPPRGGSELPLIYGGDASRLEPGTIAALPTCSGGCAVLVTCEGDTVLHNEDSNARVEHCDWEGLVRAAEAAGASAVIAVVPAGGSLQEMRGAADCDAAVSESSPSSCSEAPRVPATLLRRSDGVAIWRALGAPSMALASMLAAPPRVAFTSAATASGCTFTVSSTGTLLETGWLSPSLRVLSWAAQWLDFERRTQANLTATAASTVVVPVFNSTVMQGYPGASAAVALPAVGAFTSLTLDLALGCPTPWENSCAIWDRQMQVNLCCGAVNQSDPTCNQTFVELGRYITPFRRGLGRWLTDVTPLLPLVAAAAPQSCTIQTSTDAWAMPWTVSLSLRFGRSSDAAQPPRAVVPLWQSGGGNGGVNWGVVFDANYNAWFKPRVVAVPTWATRAVLSSVITGHGADKCVGHTRVSPDAMAASCASQ